MENQEYTPFGDQWGTEMKKWSKQELINNTKRILLENQKLKSKYEDLAVRYNDVLFDNND